METAENARARASLYRQLHCCLSWFACGTGRKTGAMDQQSRGPQPNVQPRPRNDTTSSVDAGYEAEDEEEDMVYERHYAIQ